METSLEQIKTFCNKDRNFAVLKVENQLHQLLFPDVSQLHRVGLAGGRNPGSPVLLRFHSKACERETRCRRTGRSPPSPAGSPPACTEPRSSPCTPDRTAPCRAPGPAGSPDPGSSLFVGVAWIEHRRGSRGGLRASELRRKLQTSGCSLSQGIVGKCQCIPDDQIYIISRIGATKQTSLRTPGSWSSRRRLRSHVASPLTSNMATSASLGAL